MDEAGVVASVAAAYAAGEPIFVQGGGTKRAMLRSVQAARSLSTRALAGFSLYAPKELVMSAGAGTKIDQIERVLEKSGQHLIAEPPDFSALLDAGGSRRQTLGGIVATNLSGPRRVAGGAMRDHVLGLRAVDGTGTLMRAGGRVLKNVTGLDMCKLLAGSHGTLAVMTEITLKVLPLPEKTGSVVLRGLAPVPAVAALSAALGSPYGVSGAAYLPAEAAASLGETAPLTLARIEDFAPSVAYRLGRLRRDLAEFGTVELLDDEASSVAWTAIRHADILAAEPDDAIWRVSVRPSRGPDILEAASMAGARGYLDWGGGLAMLAGPATEAAHARIAAAARKAGGVWILLRGPNALRESVQVVPEEPPALAAIARRVKAAMDPKGILNPGRLVAGL